MELRDYQLDACAAIESMLARDRSALAVMATGLGKTVCFADMVNRYAGRGVRSLILAHREELISQARRKIEEAIRNPCGVEMGESRSPEGLTPPWCVVSSVQTMCRPKRLASFAPERFGLVVVDEGHHAAAKTYRRVISRFADAGAHVLLVTATPKRADGVGLGGLASGIACDYGLSWAVDNGWLVPVRQQIVVVEGLDFSKVRTKAGDWLKADLDRILSEEGPLHRMARPIADQAQGEQGIVFCAGVRQAQALCAVLDRYMPGAAEFVCGKTDPEERRAIIARYTGGETQVLVNVGVATEGFDAPGTRWVAVGRPTRSHGLYCQIIGRGTRPLPGVVDGPETPEDRREAILRSAKPRCRVLDFVGVSAQHDIRQVTCADVLGDRVASPVREYAKKNMRECPLADSDVGRELDRAAAELELLAEEDARRRRITAEAAYRLEDSGGVGAGGGAGVRGRHAPDTGFRPPKEPPTEGMLKRLVYGLGWTWEAARALSKGQAGMMIGKGIRGRQAA